MFRNPDNRAIFLSQSMLMRSESSLTDSEGTRTDDPSVTLCLGSGSYQLGLAEALVANGMLERGLRLFPVPEVFESRGGSLVSVKKYSRFSFLSRLLWAGWRRLPGTRRSLLPIVATTWFADRLISQWIPRSTIFHGLNGNALRSLTIAKRLGAITVLESPMMHPRRWQEEVLQECDRFGVHQRDCGTLLPLPLIQRLEREFRLTDRVVVPSSTAHDSFQDEGVLNVDVILPGVDEKLFRPADPGQRSNNFRVCYTGRVELAKGVIYLLKAWKRLHLRDAELLLLGEVRPELEQALREYADPSIIYAGFLPREQVAKLLRTSSLFVFPSLHEGLALAILEAMASGLPVVATEVSGARDCITEGINGFLVPPRHEDEMADRIMWAHQNRDTLACMGMSARAEVEKMFTLRHYEGRMIEYYRSLAS